MSLPTTCFAARWQSRSSQRRAEVPELWIYHVEICPCVCIHLRLNFSSGPHLYEWVCIRPCRFWGHLVDWKLHQIHTQHIFSALTCTYWSLILLNLQSSLQEFSHSQKGAHVNKCTIEPRIAKPFSALSRWCQWHGELGSRYAIKSNSLVLKSFSGGAHITHFHSLIFCRSVDCEREGTIVKDLGLKEGHENIHYV